jgi:hypothetical protein
MTDRYKVHTVRHGVSGKPNEYWVIDRTTNLMVDEFVSKRAARMTAAQLNSSNDNTGGTQ